MENTFFKTSLVVRHTEERVFYGIGNYHLIKKDANIPVYINIFVVNMYFLQYNRIIQKGHCA